MKKINTEEDDEMKPEYRFDYSKARPNRFAEEYNRSRRAVVLDADIADNFPTAESVNEALRFWLKSQNKPEAELTNK